MSNRQVSVSYWTHRSSLLLQKARNALDKVGCNDVHLPENVYDGEKPISIVFVGQFSAGKSSLIKALTGIEDIEIGEGIRTKETHSYNWEGIEVIDTPGISTMIHPEHDELAYKAISDADLLLYVVTEELFDDYIVNDFRQILLDRDKASEMILVVNKMADVGNTEENREVRTKDLEKVTDPYSPEDLRIVFVDAKSYLLSRTQENPKLAEILLKRSNFNQFVDALNKFVEEKEVSSRLTTALYKMSEIIQECMTRFLSSSGDEDVECIEEHLRREKYIVSQTAWRVETNIRNLCEEAAARIREKGNNVAREIFDCVDEASAEMMLEKAYKEVNDIADQCKEEVVSRIEEQDHVYKARLDDFYSSDISNEVRVIIDKHKNGENKVFKYILQQDWLARGSRSILEKTTVSNSSGRGLSAFTGSKMHEWVKNIGHYFGHSFKPWEAVKWVKRVNIAGKALGVFGVVLSWGMQAKEDYDEEKRNKEIRINREKIRAAFSEAAGGLINHYKKAVRGFVDECYVKRIVEIDKQIEEIERSKQGKTDSYILLESVQEEVMDLIKEIHNIVSDSQSESAENISG